MTAQLVLSGLLLRFWLIVHCLRYYEYYDFTKIAVWRAGGLAGWVNGRPPV